MRMHCDATFPAVRFARRSASLAALARLAILAVALVSAAACLAQSGYPSRPLRFVVGFPPGGTSDTVARAVGEQLAAGLGQAVVIDNRPGAAGRIAVEVVARAPADGHTLLFTSGSITVSPSLHPHLAYDVQRDFNHFTLLADSPFILAANPKLPATNVQELVAYARARPGEVNYASSGIGTPSHLASESLQQIAKLQLTHVPYKGSALALIDLIAGRVQFYFTSFPGSLPHVRAGRVRALAVTNARRSAALPEVPTMAESGFRGFRAGTWYGLAFPRGVPPAIVNRVGAVVQKALASESIEAKLTEEGLEIRRNVTPEEAAAFIRQDIAYWATVVRRAGIRPM